jgi:hypothetical protein
MTRLIIIFLLAMPHSLLAQQKMLGAGKYPFDSTCKLCDTGKWIPEYYSLRIKYPLSSEAILNNAKAALVQYRTPFSGTGWVTIRFIVDCKGKPGCFHIYQVDENYLPAKFRVPFISALQIFLVEQMDAWPVGYVKNAATDYYAYVTFKIKDGRIENIIP